MALRPCLDCGQLSRSTRCPAHTLTNTRAVDARKRAIRPERSTAERRRRTATVQAWRTAYGDVCPGWQRDPHAASDLTADHVLPVAAGGTEDGPLAVLCRPCNSSKKNRHGG